MRLEEIKRLPLKPDMINRARGSYGAFVITMRPEDFLKLTTVRDEEIDEIKNRKFPKDESDPDHHAEYHNGRFELPFLMVEFPSGKILGHEGRHRAAMILAGGGDKFPVVIYPKSEMFYRGEGSYWDDSSGHDEKRYVETDNFASEEAAHHAIRAMLKDRDVIRSRVVSVGHNTLKGQPDRSEDWEYAAWTREDFPKQLMGQYRHVVVRDFQVGLVKGYRHFKR